MINYNKQIIMQYKELKEKSGSGNIILIQQEYAKYLKTLNFLLDNGYIESLNIGEDYLFVKTEAFDDFESNFSNDIKSFNEVTTNTDNSININGDIILNSGDKNKISMTDNDEKSNNILEGIFQNIMSNAIWYFITFILVLLGSMSVFNSSVQNEITPISTEQATTSYILPQKYRIEQYEKIDIKVFPLEQVRSISFSSQTSNENFGPFEMEDKGDFWYFYADFYVTGIHSLKATITKTDGTVLDIYEEVTVY